MEIFKYGQWVTIKRLKGDVKVRFGAFASDKPTFNHDLDYDILESAECRYNSPKKFKLENKDKSIISAWEPKSGELVIGWNENEENKYFVIGEFKVQLPNDMYSIFNPNGKNTQVDNIAPFRESILHEFYLGKED